MCRQVSYRCHGAVARCTALSGTSARPYDEHNVCGLHARLQTRLMDKCACQHGMQVLYECLIGAWWARIRPRERAAMRGRHGLQTRGSAALMHAQHLCCAYTTQWVSS